MGVWEKKADCLGNPIPQNRIAHFLKRGVKHEKNQKSV